MRHAYLMAQCDTRNKVAGETFIARGYVDEKLRLAFSALIERDLIGRLDLQRQSLYYQYLKELRDRR